MSMQEQYFPEMSRYPKISPTATPMDQQEEFLNRYPHKRAENKPNGGIIRSIPDVDRFILREMSNKERKAAKAQAWREHKQALRNLAKQDSQDAKDIHRQRAKWKVEEERKAKEKLENEREIKKAAERKKPKPKVVKGFRKSELNGYNMMMRLVESRRNDIISKLENGDQVPVVPFTNRSDKEMAAAYQMQRMDMKAITGTGLKTLRIKSLKTNLSFFVIDNMARHEMDPISGTLHLDDSKQLLKAVCSGEIVKLEDLTNGARVGARSMLKLTKESDMNIHAVFNGPRIMGWILLDKQ